MTSFWLLPRGWDPSIACHFTWVWNTPEILTSLQPLEAPPTWPASSLPGVFSRHRRPHWSLKMIWVQVGCLHLDCQGKLRVPNFYFRDLEWVRQETLQTQREQGQQRAWRMATWANTEWCYSSFHRGGPEPPKQLQLGVQYLLLGHCLPLRST